jgi:superfamily II DNA/RNA helicase
LSIRRPQAQHYEPIVAIHGGLPRDQRRAAEARFKNDPEAIVLVATDR